MKPDTGKFLVWAIIFFLVSTSIFVIEPASAPDGGGSPSGDIGWELLDNNSVLRIWNKFDSYYFNVSSGIQLTNHYNEYWSHNVMMLGYYTGDDWNIIYHVDELTGFNKNIDSDNETYVNATIWKDLSYGSYDFRLAIRYCLGVNDSELTIIPYIKNLGIAIPHILGFAWELKDIQIDMTPENDFIEINGTSFYLNETLDVSFTNMSIPIYCWNNETNETYVCGYTPIPYFHVRENKTNNTSESLYLRWNSSLNYKVQVKSRDGQYNAPVILGIRIGTLAVDEEKYTKMFWYDASEMTFYSHTDDGRVTHQGTNWNTVRTAATGSGADSTEQYATSAMRSSSTGGLPATYTISRSFFYFDTSGLPDTATISAAALKIYGYDQRDSSVSVQEGTQRTGALTTADYDAFNVGLLHDSISAWTTGGYNNFGLNNAGLSAISKTGNTFYCTREYTYDYGGKTPAAIYDNGCYYKDFVFGGREPKLTVTYTMPDTTPPDIIINYAGNLGDKGGPYWRPPGESVQLTGAWSDGYYANDSRQSEDWIYINCTITDTTGVGDVWLNWLNETTWTNYTYPFSNTAGDYWEINTSSHFSTAGGYDYSFNIVANDTVSPVNSNTTWWNKTGLGDSYTRRYVQLNSSTTNILYTPIYLQNTTYSAGDFFCYDCLQHDQGPYVGDDTIFMNTTLPGEIPSFVWCGSFIGMWYNANLCNDPITLSNIYYHIWWNEDDDIQGDYEGIGWNHSRENTDWHYQNEYETTQSESHSNITLNIQGVRNFHLDTHSLTVSPTYKFTDNNIFELVVGWYGSDVYGACNRSYTSFILLNVPDNATLDSSHNDTDGDGLWDRQELYEIFTNPFLADTDNDGVDDYDEVLSGSDPNNYTSTTQNSAPTITGEIPANQSVDISTTPTLNVTVDDANDNTLDSYWYSNSTGPWALFGSNLSIDTSGGGVNISQINTNFSENSKTYWWSVNATDGGLWTNETYHFTTEAADVNNPPVQTSPCIWNVTTGENKSLNATNVDLFPTCFNVTVNDTDGDYMNISIMTNESGSWTVVNATISGMLNGTFRGYNTSWVDSYSTKYWISFNVSDDEDWCNETYNFTTTCSLIFDINRTSFGFGTIQNDTMVYSNETEPDTFRIYNNGTCSIDIDINGTNATATGVSDWVLSAANGDNLYKMDIYNSTTNWWQINLTKDTWYSNMAQSTNIIANIRITTPTVFYSGKQMACTIYMTASIH